MIAADNVPRVTSLEQARLRPTWTALSAALHGCNGDLECVRVAIAAFRDLPEKQRRRYTLTVLASLPEHEFDIIQGELNDMEESDPLFEIEARSGLFKYVRRKMLEEERDEGRKEGRDEGRKEGRDEGRKEGRKEGRDEGRKAMLIEMIFALLEVRKIEVDEQTAVRIRACEDLHELEHWARRAREVDVATELFSS